MKWYKGWHEKKIHRHVHVAILLVYIFSIFASTFINPQGTHASLSQTSRGITTQDDFNKGGFDNTSTSSNGDVSLNGFSSLSNNGGGVWKYKRPITIDNTANLNTLNDYQVQFSPSEVKDSVIYHMEETTGNVVIDSSGNAVNGVANGQIGLSGPTTIAGRFGNALNFDGVDDQLDLGNPAILKSTVSQSISMWIKPTDLVGRKTVYNKSYGAEGTFNVEPSGTAQYYYGSRGMDGTPYQSFTAAGSPIVAGTWTHVVIVRDLRSMKLRWYINGIKNLEGSTSIPVPATSLANLIIGNGYAGRYKGGIDEIGIYSGVLSDTDVTQLYNNGTLPITSDSIFEKSATDGRDIRFTDSDGTTELPYWTEAYSKSWRYSKNWVKVPTIAATTTKTIYMYYGNSLATNSSSPSGAAVREIGGLQASWSLDNTFQDSSGNGNTSSSGFYSRTTLSNGDNAASWSGNTITADVTDKQEGAASLQDTVSTPSAATTYKTILNPTGSLDLRYPDYTFFWFKSDRASTAFTNPRFYIYDTLGNYKYWNLTFSAGTWQYMSIQMSAPSGQSTTAPNMLLTDSYSVELTTNDATAFYKKIDYLEYRFIADSGEWSSIAKSYRSGNFDGREDFISAPNNSFTSQTNAYTLEAWINTRQSILGGTDRQMIFSKWGNSGGSNINYSLEINPSGKLVAKSSAAAGTPAVTATGNTILASNQWYHVAVTFDSTSMIVYLNGVSDGSVATGFNAYINTNILKIGSFDFTWTAYKHNFYGYIDDPKIFNRALSPQELGDLANNYGYSSVSLPGKVVVVKATTVIPPTSIGVESNASSLSGTYLTSSTMGQGAIDLFWNGGWGTNISNFNADVVIPSGSSIGFHARTSSTGGIDDSWSGWVSLGTASATGVFATPDNSSDPMDGLPVNRYIQIKAVFSSSGAISPLLKDLNLVYLTDTSSPQSPTNMLAYGDASKTGNLIVDNSWNNFLTPYFEWTGVTEPINESGVAGYWVYFGTDSTADPKTAGTFVSSTSYQAIIAEADSGKTFYLAISTEDNAGNRLSMSAPDYYKKFTYKFDRNNPDKPSNIEVTPFGWSTTNSFDFRWGVATDLVFNGGSSGVSYYEYQRDGEGLVWHRKPINECTTTCSVTGLTSLRDGSNVFRVHTVDSAGNSSADLAATYRYNGSAPSKPQSLMVSPQSSTVNEFTFKWDEPLTHNAPIKEYRYSVNALPEANNSKVLNYTIDPVDLKMVATPEAPATKQNFNTLYLVAVDSNDNVSYSPDNVAQVTFECNTPAPGFPLRPEVFDTSNRDLQKYSVAFNWTEPTYKGVGFRDYQIERSLDSVNFSYVGSGSGTSFIDTNLESKPYYYRVLARDNSNNVSAPSEVVSITPTGRYTSAPEITVEPEVAVKVSTAVIRWVTDRSASSFVEIGDNDQYGLTQGQFDFVSDHRVSLAGLKPNTVYHYRVKFVDEDGNIGYSSDKTLQTEPAPRVERVSINDVRLYTAVLTWYTSEPAESNLLYGRGTGYGSEIKNVSGGSTTVHSVRLESLEHSSTYHFAVRIKDIDGNEILSDDYSFETQKFPVISVVRMDSVKDRSSATARITWQTNVPTGSVVEYTPAGGSTQEVVKTKLETSHDLLITGLIDNTYYRLVAKSTDQYGNTAISDVQNYKTDFDTRSPILSSLSYEVSSSGYGVDAKTQIVVYWESDEPSTSQIEYGVGLSGDYGSKSMEDATLGTSHVVVVPDLKPSTSYHLRAVSRDSSRNEGLSEETTVLTEQAKSSILDVVLQTLQHALGWMFGA